MKQQVVLITGGSSGIGKAIGIFLKSKGFQVYGTTRNLEKNSAFSDFTLVQLDVRDPESVSAGVARVIGREGKLDILINNAGVGITGPVEETPHEEILNAFETNFHGPLHLIKAVLPQMRKQGSGCIINITSIAGYMGLPFRGVYSASKGALELVTEALRMECKDSNIRIVNLAPGDFATNIAAGRYHAPVKEGSPYENTYGDSLELMNEHVSAGGDPKRVAEKVFSIIQKQHPKGHYRVGSFMQKFSVVLKRFLPSALYERLLLRHYKL